MNEAQVENAVLIAAAIMMTIAIAAALIAHAQAMSCGRLLGGTRVNLDEMDRLFEDLGADAPRRWIDPAAELPAIAERVECWIVENRLSLDETKQGDEAPAYGYFLGTHWMVEGDPLAVVLAWRPAAKGPVTK